MHLYFLNYYQWNFVHHKNRVHSITCKPFKISSRNFIWIKTCRRAKRKNVLVISLGISLVNKNVRWMYNTIRLQKGGRHLCFCRKKSSIRLVLTKKKKKKKKILTLQNAPPLPQPPPPTPACFDHILPSSVLNDFNTQNWNNGSRLECKACKPYVLFNCINTAELWHVDMSKYISG